MNDFPEKVSLATDGLENATLAARAAVDHARKGGVEREELIVLGTPDRAIIAAEEVGADTIVLGAEGKSRMEQALTGSVAANVIRHANQTVLFVGGRPESETPEDGTPEDGTPENGTPESERFGVR